jgi:hypothetical protein
MNGSTGVAAAFEEVASAAREEQEAGELEAAS